MVFDKSNLIPLGKITVFARPLIGLPLASRLLDVTNNLCAHYDIHVNSVNGENGENDVIHVNRVTGAINHVTMKLN